MSTTINPHGDIIQPIWDLLAKWVPNVKSFFGAKFVAETGAQPPRYVWVPTTGNPDSDDGGNAQLGAPRNLSTVEMTFEVHCWAQAAKPSQDPLKNAAADFDAAWQLLANLVSAVREVITVNYSLGSIDATPTEEIQQGCLLTLPITILLPLYETDLDQPTYTTTQATAVRIDDSAGVDPDGTLTAPLK